MTTPDDLSRALSWTSLDELRSERPRLIVTEKVNETGSLHRIIEILHRECTLSCMSRAEWERLLKEVVTPALKVVHSRFNLQGLPGARCFFPLRFNFAHDPNRYFVNVSGAEDGYRTLEEHYAYCFNAASPLHERVIIHNVADHCFLFSQHCILTVETEALETHVGRFNKPIHAARRALHWQKYKLLLLANRSTDEDHGGLERLSIELIQTIGNFLVHGEKDRHGREYVPLDAFGRWRGSKDAVWLDECMDVS